MKLPKTSLRLIVWGDLTLSMKVFGCCCVWSGQVTSFLHPDVTVLAHILGVSVVLVGETGCIGLIKCQWAPKELGPSASLTGFG